MSHLRIRRFKTREWYPQGLGEESAHIDAEFCMAVRAGSMVFLRGQTGFDLEGNLVGPGDPAAQAEQACKNIATLLAEAGASMADVAKITVYVTDRSYRKAVYGVIARHFAGVYPCSTGLVVNGLALPEMLVEIDVFAVIPDARAGAAKK